MTTQSETEAVVSTLREINDHFLLRANRSWWRSMGTQFLRGLAFGLGSVVGATILVSVLAYFLSQIDFIPIIGTYASEIAREIQAPR